MISVINNIEVLPHTNTAFPSYDSIPNTLYLLVVVVVFVVCVDFVVLVLVLYLACLIVSRAQH